MQKKRLLEYSMSFTGVPVKQCHKPVKLDSSTVNHQLSHPSTLRTLMKWGVKKLILQPEWLPWSADVVFPYIIFPYTHTHTHTMTTGNVRHTHKTHVRYIHITKIISSAKSYQTSLHSVFFSLQASSRIINTGMDPIPPRSHFVLLS